jgi:putative ABC transport system permease protein
MLGLAVSTACCILIMLFVRSELSYDAFHSKSGRLYRVWQRVKANNKDNDNVITALLTGDAIKSSFPGVDAACRVYSITPIVKVGQTSFTDKVDLVDPSFFHMFDFRVIKGNSINAFSIDNSIVITTATAQKYFGNSNAIGKTIELQLGTDKVPFTVSGIVNEAPESSSIQYHALISFANGTHLFKPDWYKNWFFSLVETYVLLKPGIDPLAMEKGFPGMMKQQLGADFSKMDFTLHLQPIKDIHLDTNLPAGIEPISNPKYAYILSSIGLLILIVACINFITLSVGHSAKRALEVGIRKALGAERKQFIFQFWGETFLVVLISVMIGLCLAMTLVKPFDTLVNRQLNFKFDPAFILFCLSIIIIIATISGIYPALILSGFKPVEVLRGKINIKGGKGWLSQGLVVIQFATSIVMIIGNVVIGQQMHYLQVKDLGYKKEQTVIVETNKPRKEGLTLAALYRNELLKHSQVLSASVSVYSFAETPWITIGYQDEQKQDRTFQVNGIDANFVPALGITMVSGRNFRPITRLILRDRF